MNKNESKYFNTAVRMDKALIAILEKKDFPYITVKEICDKAGVNRSTFYLHYENTSELLAEASRHVLDKFLSYFSMDTERISSSFVSSELDSLFFITPEYLTPYLTFIKENRRIFKTSLKQFGNMRFDEVYDKMFTHIFHPILSRFNVPADEHKYVMKFYLSGVTAVVLEWIGGGCTDEMDKISDVIIKCIPQADTHGVTNEKA